MGYDNKLVFLLKNSFKVYSGNLKKLEGNSCES